MKNLPVLISFLFCVSLAACKKNVYSGATGPERDDSRMASKTGTTSSSGILQWQKTFGSSSDDAGYAVTNSATYDGYLAAGYSNGNDGNVSGNHGGHDAWVVKTGLNGALAWQKVIGGSGVDEANAVVSTTDGGCLVTGYTTSNDGDISGYHGGGDLLLIKMTSSGTIDWVRPLGGSGYDRGWALINTADGGFALAGQTTSSDGDLIGTTGANANTNGKIWLIKFDNNINIQWQTVITFDGSKNDVGYSITQGADGGFTIGGTTLSVTDNADICVANVSASGNLNWRKTIGSSGTAGDVAFGATTSAANDGFVVTGYMANNLVAIKYNNGGDIVWQKIFSGGAGGSGYIRGRSIIAMNTGYLITGFTSTKNGDINTANGSDDLLLLRLDANGNKTGSNVLGGSASDMGMSVIAAPDGTYVAAGLTYSNNGDVSGNHGSSDMWVLKVKF